MMNSTVNSYTSCPHVYFADLSFLFLLSNISFYSKSRLVGAVWIQHRNLFFVFYKLTCWQSTTHPVSRLVLFHFLLCLHFQMEFNIWFGLLVLQICLFSFWKKKMDAHVSFSEVVIAHIYHCFWCLHKV